MKQVVVYQSKTGFTARYAKWIAAQLGCEVKERKKIKLSELSQYDQVIYGGWIMGDHVVGLNKVKQLNLPKLVIFGVGMSPANEEVKAKLMKVNQIGPEGFFYYEGGYHPEQLGFITRKLMGMIRKSVEKKENKTKDDLRMLETFDGADRSDQKAISELVQYCSH